MPRRVGDGGIVGAEQVHIGAPAHTWAQTKGARNVIASFGFFAHVDGGSWLGMGGSSVMCVS